MKILVVGCGSIGKRHLKNLKSLKIGELAGVETDVERRETIGRELDIPVYTPWGWRFNMASMLCS